MFDNCSIATHRRNPALALVRDADVEIVFQLPRGTFLVHLHGAEQLLIIASEENADAWLTQNRTGYVADPHKGERNVLYAWLDDAAVGFPGASEKFCTLARPAS